MDYSNQQELYDTIKRADNSDLWSLSGAIAKTVQKATKDKDKAITNLNKAKTTTKKENGSNLPALPEDISDAELRTHVKKHLLLRLGDGSLSASEIGQLKDVFNLASQTEELSIVVESYENAIIDCPHCGENVHKPTCVNASK